MQGTIIILDRHCIIPYQQTAVLHPGVSYKIIVKGRMSDSPVQFAIDILDELGARLIHINPRWNANRVVINSFDPISGWGPEEYAYLNLKPNQTFDISITDREDFFWVRINNEVEFIFRKRIKPASAVRTVKVCKVDRDDITLHSVQMDEFFY